MAHPPFLNAVDVYDLTWMQQVPSAVADVWSYQAGRHGGGSVSRAMVVHPDVAFITFNSTSLGIDTKNLGTNYTRGAVVFGVYGSSTPTVQIGEGDNCQLTLIFSTGSTVVVRRGGVAGTILDSQTMTTWNTGQWNDVQIVWEISDTTGSVWVRINGTVHTNISSQNTKDSSNSYWNRIRFGIGSSQWDSIAWADMSGYSPSDLNTAYRFWRATPTADNSVQFTANSGSNNYSRVNTNDGDTTYNHSTTVGHVDRFDVSGDWVPSGADICLLRIRASGRIDDATLHTIRTKVWSNGVVANGSNKSLPGSYDWVGVGDMFHNDPNTSARWGTSNAIQTIDIGYEIVSKP